MEFNLKIGADPELFVKRGDLPVPAWGMIPGDKKAPHKVNKGAIQVDGLAVEFNIDPASTAEEFDENISTVVAQLDEAIKGNHPDNRLVCESSQKFTLNDYYALPAEAVVVGCDPDFNANDEGRPNRYDKPHNNRYAGGHVHIGWTEGQDVHSYEHMSACIMLARQLDYYMLPALWLQPRDERRSTYGWLGNFRPKHYGVEYRTPSNFWVMDSNLRRWMFSQITNAFNEMVHNEHNLWEDIKFGNVCPIHWWASNVSTNTANNLKANMCMPGIKEVLNADGLISFDPVKEKLPSYMGRNQLTKATSTAQNVVMGWGAAKVVGDGEWA